jgi:hypothetical protein
MFQMLQEININDILFLAASADFDHSTDIWFRSGNVYTNTNISHMSGSNQSGHHVDPITTRKPPELIGTNATEWSLKS